MATHVQCETARTMATSRVREPSVARDVVALATRAPSLHNTQPWRWRIVSADVLELFAAHDRQLLLQVGWRHTASARLSPSPRRPLDDVIVP